MSTNFSPVTPYIRRILLQDDLFDNKLKISSESMLKYGTSTIDTSNPIVLKVLSGGAWEVKLTKFDDDDHLWLGEGRFKACAKWGDGLGEHFVVPSIKALMTTKEKEKEIDLSRNENLASQNPFFKSVIQKTHLHNQYDMALPKDFWRQNVDENSCHYITLYVLHDQNKIWPVRLYARLRSTCPFRRAAFRKKDWQRFVDENHLKVGDVCIFELIDKNEMKFRDNTMKFGSSSKAINGTASSSKDGKLFGGEIKQSNPTFRVKLAVSGSRVQVEWFYVVDGLHLLKTTD
ncbi:hypothetical protein F8388_017045 [Cannabis sativa]|uniref:TF-B3 domain-containing protein n=1 Tax=Cannabis sativa TaxID=3483 RepID=A0A7J6GCL1_CANSA|nr:hypothetical protein F8388_017045 [Cannabis sativa]